MITTSPDKNYCPDCGMAGVNHLVSKISIILGFLLRVMTAPLAKIEDAIVGFLWPRFELLMPFLFRTLAFFRLGVVTDKLESDNIMRTKCMWEAAKRRGISVSQFRVFNRPTIIFFAEFKGQTIVFDGLPRPKGRPAESLSWMDNKAVMKRKFSAAGIPVARGGVAMTKAGALKIFRRLKPPVIMKPNLGSRSRHTTIHILNEAELLSAFRKAKRLSPWVIVEEELSGFVYRITLIGGKVVGVLRREPPFVVGDGARSVLALIDEENKNPKRHGPIFHEISVDGDLVAELARQNLQLDSIPEKGRFVTLNQKIGRSQGGTNTEMFNDIHPENTALFEKLARVLGDPLVGVDFIMMDIEKPWTKQSLCGAIECNSLPFLDLHNDPFRGEALNPSRQLWDLVFPEY